MVGHVCVLVLILNISHGLGIPAAIFRWLARILLILVAAASLAPWILLFTMSWDDWPILVRAYAWSTFVVGVVCFPTITWIRLRRRPPGHPPERERILNLAEEGGAGPWIGEGRHAWLLRLPGNRSLSIHYMEYPIEIAGLPRDLDGFSILHLSDFHFSMAYSRSFFERAVAEAVLHQTEHDLVVFTGDLVDDLETLSWTSSVLEQVRGRLGQYSVLGNHDYQEDPALIRAALSDAGFPDLGGRWVQLGVRSIEEDHRAVIALGGTAYPWGPVPPLDQPPESDLRILLAHSPDLFRRAVKSRIDLVLSGHTHGGQIRFPVVGPIAMPSRYSRRFDRGFFEAEQTLMFVHQGLGAKHPVRYGCPPEIVTLRLRARV